MAGFEIAQQAELGAEHLREEVRHEVVRRVLAGENPAESLAVVVRVRPVLDQPAVPEDRVVEARDVSGGVDTGDVRLEALVHEHGAVVRCDARVLEVARRRQDADPHDRKVCAELVSASRHGAREPAASAAELRDRRAEQHVDAVVAVEPLERARDGRRRSAAKSPSAGSTSVTARPRLRSEAAVSMPMNPAPTTTAEPATAAAARTASASASVRNECTPASCSPTTPSGRGKCAGGEDETFVPDGGPVGEGDGVAPGVDPGDRRPEPDHDVELRISGRRLHEDGAGLELAAEEALRERWPVVGERRLGGEHVSDASPPASR